MGGVHLAVLWGFAVVQPLFDDLSRNAEFFVARGNTASDILLLAFGVTLLPPLVLTAVALGAQRLSGAVARGLQLGLVGLLAAAFAVGPLKGILSSSATILPLAAGLGAGAAVAYARTKVARSFLTVLAPAPAVFLAAFLLFSPVNDLVMPRDAAQASARVASRTPVVLVIFDELPTISLMDRRGRIDARSFPNFARLARTSTWYRNATTVGDGTHLAVPSILSGRLPVSDLPTARRYPRSIFTLVGGRYDLRVHEPITRVCPERLCVARPPPDPPGDRLRSLISDLAVVEAHLLLPDDLADGLPPIDRDFEDFGDEEDALEPVRPRIKQPPRAIREVDGAAALRIAGTDLFARRVRDAERFVHRLRRAGRRPPATVAHFVVPHVPWRLLPSGRQYPIVGTTLPGSTDRTWTRDAFLVDQAMQRHLLQVGYADRLLGRLVTRLKETGVWDDALVAVVADHGIGLRPGGSRREIHRGDFAAIAGVPLFVKRPRQRAALVDAGPARTIDIVPTIATALGTRPDRQVDGVQLGTRRTNPLLHVRRGAGGEVAVRFDEFVRARDAELARQRGLLPAGLASVFHSGPFRELLGRRPDALVAGVGAGRIRINDAGALARVDLRSGVLPVYVSGYFTSAKEEGQAMAVALNGRIRAVCFTYPVGNTVRFSALVPPRSLRRGANHVEVFQIGAAGVLLRLAQD